MVNDLPIDVSRYSFVNVGYISDHRVDISSFHVFISTYAHPATQYCLAIYDCFCHAAMSVICNRSITVPLTSILVGFMAFLLELGMTQFVAHLVMDDLAILDCDHRVIGCAAKVLADGLAIVCDYCDFHNEVLH